jgi:tetratricopeptide (TPR) repeat protein
LLFDDGHAAEALAHLEEACRIDRKLLGAFYALSPAQRAVGAGEAARDSMKRFNELKSEEKAELDRRNTGYDDEAFMRALAAGFHTDVAEFLVRKQQVQLAEAHLRQAVRIDPRGPRGYEVLAGLLVQAGQLGEARELYAALVELRPARAGYHLNLGTVLLQLGDHEAGAAELQRALELDPLQPEALRNLSRFQLSARRDLPGALNLCRRLVESKPTAASYDLLAWALYANGRIDEARDAAGHAAELEPTNPGYRERYQRLQAKP